MLRTPEPKEQARLLVQLLKADGCEMPYQRALHVVAQLHGHRNWNVMQAAKPATASAATPVAAAQAAAEPDSAAPPQSARLTRLLQAARDVVCSAEATGCTDDLTVASADAIERLDQCLDALDEDPQGAADEDFMVHGFGIGDVQTIRPDLSPAQARQVLEVADHRFDAEIGLNWTVLETHADYEFGHFAVECRLPGVLGLEDTLTLDLCTGKLFVGSLDEVASQYASQRVAFSWNAHPGLDPQMARLLLPDGSFVDLEGQTTLYPKDSEALAHLVEDLREFEASTGQQLLKPLK